MSDPIELLSMDVPCDHRAPATVRRALSEAASGWRSLGDGLLVASELVTNAVLHSGCANHHRIQVHARVLDGRLQISVHDPGITKQDAVLRQSAHTTQPGGWGLRIVDQLARRWGTERPDGYRVWAEVALSS